MQMTISSLRAARCVRQRMDDHSGASSSKGIWSTRYSLRRDFLDPFETSRVRRASDTQVEPL